MPVPGSVKHRTTIYPWSVLRPADASTRPCFAAISLPNLPNGGRTVLARYSVELGLGEQFARLASQLETAGDLPFA
jgi:hypothetical protein